MNLYKRDIRRGSIICKINKLHPCKVCKMDLDLLYFNLNASIKAHHINGYKDDVIQHTCVISLVHLWGGGKLETLGLDNSGTALDMDLVFSLFESQ